MSVPKQKVKKILKLASIWVVVIFVFGEIGARLFVEFPIEYEDEKTACYRYDETLGWFPQENTECVYTGMYRTEISNNKDGFRDREHENDSTKKSIAFLGDSFVWGYDVKEKKRFTSNIQAFLPEWEIYNMGVSGYGTDQEYILLKKWFPKYTPDVVYVVVHSNDSIDNRNNYNYNYYKPYFQLEKNELSLKGTPVPKCFRYQQRQYPIAFKSKFIQSLFLLNNRITKAESIVVPDLRFELLEAMHSYLKENGAEFRVVFTYAGNDPKEIEFLESAGIKYQHLPTKHKFKEYGQHWTPKGHEHIASKILEGLFLDSIITVDDIEKYPDLD